MTLWIGWSVLVSSLVALATLAAERVSAALGVARRGVWIGAIVASVTGSLVVASRTESRGQRTRAVTSTALASRSGGSVNSSVGPVGSSSLGAIERILNAKTITAADHWAARIWAVMSLTWLSFLGVSVEQMRRRRLSWTETKTELGPVFVARDEGPAVMGVLAPRVVMPAWALERDAETRGLMLRHELEHLRAGDSRVLFASALLTALVPWNPALWFMSRRLRLAIEIDCDRRVIRSLGTARTYGLMLLDVSDRYTARLPASALLFERGAQLEARIHAMTKPLPKHPLAVAALSAAITGLVLATAAWTPRPNPFRAASPTLRAIGGPQLLNGNPAPRYPDQMRATNEEGVVVAAFVTDKSGAPDTVSVSIVQTTNEAFASSVKAVLPRLRYSGPGAVVFTCRFQITARDHRRDPSYVSPQYVSGVDTTRQIVVTGVSPSP